MLHTHGLTDDHIMKNAPSVFAEHPAEDVSNRYAFVPTIDVINRLRNKGFYPVSIREMRCRKEKYKGFQKHMLRFRHKSETSHLAVGDEVVELVLLNSHNRTSGFQLHAGVYRCVCTNQMVVSSGEVDRISMKHIGSSDDIIDAAFTIIEQAPVVHHSISDMKALPLSQPEKEILAESTLELLDTEIKPTVPQLLYPRRSTDQANNLWSTLNVIQENAIKGGQYAGIRNGRQVRTRAVKSIDKDVKLNRALWTLAERMKTLKG